MSSEHSTPSLVKLAVPFLGLVAGIQTADPNIASTALVSASKSLSMESSVQALAASISTLALAATVISTGLLADRLGRRRVLSAGLVLAIVGDLIVAASPVTATFLAGRLIAGIGLGAVFGAAFGYLTVVTTAKTLPGALGVFGAVTGLTVLAMTFIGGSMIAIDWRVGYLLVPVLSALSLILVPLVLPAVERNTEERQDIPGQIALVVAVAGTLLGISRLGDGIGAPTFFIPTVIGIAAFVGFFINQSRSESRFFPISLFRNPIFIAALLIGAAFNFGNSIAYLQLTNLWQYITELSASAVAVWQLPFTAAAVVAALVIGRAMQRGLPIQTVALLGAIVLPLGFVLIALAAGSSSFFAFLPGAMLLGAGINFFAVIYGGLIIREAPPEHYGPVTSSRTTIGQFFYSVGLAIGTLAIDRLTEGGTVKRLEAAGVPPHEIGRALDPVTQFFKTGQEPTTQAAQAALAQTQASYVTSFQIVMVAAGLAVLIAGMIATRLLRRELAPAANAAAAQSA
jgi:MFS family permease